MRVIYKRSKKSMIIYILLVFFTVVVFFSYRSFYSTKPPLGSLIFFAKNYVPKIEVVELGEGERRGECYPLSKDKIPGSVQKILNNYDKNQLDFKKSILLIVLKQYNCDIEYSGISTSLKTAKSFFKSLDPLYYAFLDLWGEKNAEYITTADVIELLNMPENEVLLIDAEINSSLNKTSDIYVSRGWDTSKLKSIINQ